MDFKGTESLMAALRNLRVTGAYADMTIKCGDHELKGHKAVICPRSAFFEAKFKDNKQETSTSAVDMSEHDLRTVSMVLDFFYQLDYEPTSVDSPPPQPSTIAPALNGEVHPSVEDSAEVVSKPLEAASLVAAETNGLGTSKKAKKKKKKALVNGTESQPLDVESQPLEAETHALESEPQPLSRNGSSLEHTDTPNGVARSPLLDHCRVYALANTCQVEDLKILAADKFRQVVLSQWDHPDFLEAIRLVYQNSVATDRYLRDTVVQTIQSHMSLLDRDDYREAVQGLDLAFELLMAVHKAESLGSSVTTWQSQEA